MINTNPEASKDFYPVLVTALIVLVLACDRFIRVRGLKDR